ncbi:MAG: bifunctional hydroxymethylpyrimidine kinase/phosphomethylpyrimidine kinase [Gammaproteobacteria bacterium]
MQPKKYIRTLTIAGSDSGGGAGIQADLKTFAALGCYGMSAITCLTAQNTQAVKAIYPATAEFVQQQIEAVISDIGVDAIKIGMLFNIEIIQAVAKTLQNLNNIPIVLDPVMVATSGDLLLEENAINILKDKLFPLATIITPNLHEAEVILQKQITSCQQIECAAKELCKYGSSAILIKGGHLKEDDSSDCLYLANENKILWLKTEKIKTKNTHGTGCTLSAAIAAYLAKEDNLTDAVKNAKNYITTAIKAGAAYQIGHGCGPVCHMGVKS